MKKTAEIKYLISVFIFGTIAIFTRQIDLPTEFIVMSRGILGTAFIFVYSYIRGHRIDFKAIGRNFGWLVGSGVALGLNWVFLFAAYEYNVAVASLCNYLAPIIVVILAPFLYKEKLSLPKIGCIIAAFGGIVCVSGVLSSSGGMNIKVVLLGLGAAVGFVVLVIFNRKLTKIEVYDKAMVQLLASALTVLPYFIFNNWGKTLTFNIKSILIILTLGILHTGIAYCLYFDSLGKVSVISFAILGYMEPVICVISSYFILGEPMDVFGWIGAVLIIGAALSSELLNIKGVKKK